MSTLKVGAIRGVSASSDAITVASDGTCTANVTNNLSNRNLIINGDMKINQRSGTYNRPSGDEYTVDRFMTKTGSSFNFDTLTTQATDAPSGFTNSLKITPQSTQTPTGSDNGTIRYIIEGQDCDALAHGTSDAKKVTLSFYAKSASSNNNQVYTVQLTKRRNSDGTKYYLTQTFTVTSSWQRFTMSFVADTTNDIKNDNTEGIAIYWHLASGPDDIVSAQATWLANNGFRAATGQSNFMDNTSNEFYLTGVQLEVDNTGSGKATDFEHRSFGQEFALCQRYYQQFDDSANPGSYIWGIAYGGGGNSAGLVIYYQNVMRAIPTASGENLNNLNFNDGTAAYTAANNTFGFGGSEYGIRVSSSSLGSMTGKAIQVYSNSTTNTKIKLEAEL